MKTIVYSVALLAILAGCATTPEQAKEMSDKELCERSKDPGLTTRHKAVYDNEIIRRGVSCVTP